MDEGTEGKIMVEVKDISIPEDIFDQWQNLLDIVATRANVSSALIMKIGLPDIEVFISSRSKGNPFKAGEKEKLLGSGVYCEKVYKTKKKLFIANALKDEEWSESRDVELGMISYLGFPIFWPDGSVFGTICILDSKERRFGEEYEKLVVTFKRYIEARLDLELSRQAHEGKDVISRKDMYCDTIFTEFEKMLKSTDQSGSLNLPRV